MKVAARFLGQFAVVWLATSAEPSGEPFTPLQRLQPEQLKAAHEAVERFARLRQDVLNLGGLEDIRAVIHVHAQDSDHTKGTREQVLAAARKTGVRAVLLTDHRGPKPDTWQGLRDGVLFLAGSEDGGGPLRFPRVGSNLSPQAEGDLRFLSHIEERYEADTKGFDGMEIVNRHTDAVLDRSVAEYLERASKDAAVWSNVVERFRAYPDEMFAAGCDYRSNIVAKWDREIQHRHLTGIGANDAHQNVILNGTTLDPYEVSFRNLSTHILARELSEADIRAALRDGHCYVSHDWLCDPSGFTFGAINTLGLFPMGDTVPMRGTTRVVGLTPLPSRLKLFYNGSIVSETNGTNLTFHAKKPGAYRLEAWLNVAGEERPWIYSNPVYLQEQSLLSMPLPNAAEAPNVEVMPDLTYTTEHSEVEAKHKLDLYLPKNKTEPAPVLFFVHGGAWRYGDRKLYSPLGQRFAREGILTVIPSYRLAPQYPHPAQIEDTAAAFAWTVRHIAEHGGDTNRIYVAGHSAGGHLVALLALHERYLRELSLSPKVIRGVITLSGVYNLDVGDAPSKVFGSDRSVRREASPLFHIATPAPPFFVSYCEWDYPMLPAQAKIFQAALRRAGVSVQSWFTPRESHISEMIAITHDEDPTGQAVVKFILGPAP
jgi:acetyl esterase/lipase